ncbi:rhodanese-like domain-containing protein [Thalassobellus suaedae]|uniref:Rhodanese-like domain-containing protein n=1 Tax=Thalassobellus suaedae TaxID=3074124 RepID=A0ABY9XPT7_9FLAO|nr:rhodanese-like domain-containing protein [Flavobacteriaceae bacterium HL-DH14]WNH13124.1 rhodanese-like domain-containing protein [Flavobacteriaceae bacterium HL-DH10]
MKYLVLYFWIVIISLGSGCKKVSNQEFVKVISPKEMQVFLEVDSVQLIDVRTPKEFSEGFIDNAQNIDFFSPTFKEEISKLNKSKPVFVYCKSGGRSGKSVNVFLDAGFTKIYDLEGGFLNWKSQGLRTVK